MGDKIKLVAIEQQKLIPQGNPDKVIVFTGIESTEGKDNLARHEEIIRSAGAKKIVNATGKVPGVHDRKTFFHANSSFTASLMSDYPDAQITLVNGVGDLAKAYEALRDERSRQKETSSNVTFKVAKGEKELFEILGLTQKPGGRKI